MRTRTMPATATPAAAMAASSRGVGCPKSSMPAVRPPGSHAVAGKVTYGNSRTFLAMHDPGRVHPVTGARERRPPPAPRSSQSMRDTAAEYARLLREQPAEADVHYVANGQGAPSPLFALPYEWTAVPDGMHVVQPSSHCRVAKPTCSH